MPSQGRRSRNNPLSHSVFLSPAAQQRAEFRELFRSKPDPETYVRELRLRAKVPLTEQADPVEQEGDTDSRTTSNRSTPESFSHITIGQFRPSDLHLLKRTKKALGIAKDFEHLRHKELVYLHMRRRAYRNMRNDMWRAGASIVKDIAVARHWDPVPPQVEEALKEGEEGRISTTQLRTLWPAPFLQLEEEWDEIYLTEFPEVVDRPTRDPTRWTTFFTPFSRSFLSRPSPFVQTVMRWKPYEPAEDPEFPTPDPYAALDEALQALGSEVPRDDSLSRPLTKRRKRAAPSAKSSKAPQSASDDDTISLTPRSIGATPALAYRPTSNASYDILLLMAVKASLELEVAFADALVGDKREEMQRTLSLKRDELQRAVDHRERLVRSLQQVTAQLSGLDKPVDTELRPEHAAALTPRQRVVAPPPAQPPPAPRDLVVLTTDESAEQPSDIHASETAAPNTAPPAPVPSTAPALHPLPPLPDFAALLSTALPRISLQSGTTTVTWPATLQADLASGSNIRQGAQTRSLSALLLPVDVRVADGTAAQHHTSIPPSSAPPATTLEPLHPDRPRLAGSLCTPSTSSRAIQKTRSTPTAPSAVKGGTSTPAANKSALRSLRKRPASPRARFVSGGRPCAKGMHANPPGPVPGPHQKMRKLQKKTSALPKPAPQPIVTVPDATQPSTSDQPAQPPPLPPDIVDLGSAGTPARAPAQTPATPPRDTNLLPSLPLPASPLTPDRAGAEKGAELGPPPLEAPTQRTQHPAQQRQQQEQRPVQQLEQKQQEPDRQQADLTMKQQEVQPAPAVQQAPQTTPQQQGAPPETTRQQGQSPLASSQQVRSSPTLIQQDERQVPSRRQEQPRPAPISPLAVQPAKQQETQLTPAKHQQTPQAPQQQQMSSAAVQRQGNTPPQEQPQTSARQQKEMQAPPQEREQQATPPPRQEEREMPLPQQDEQQELALQQGARQEPLPRLGDQQGPESKVDEKRVSAAPQSEEGCDAPSGEQRQYQADPPATRSLILSGGRPRGEEREASPKSSLQAEERPTLSPRPNQLQASHLQEEESQKPPPPRQQQVTTLQPEAAAPVDELALIIGRATLSWVKGLVRKSDDTLRDTELAALRRAVETAPEDIRRQMREEYEKAGKALPAVLKELLPPAAAASSDEPV